MKRLKLVLILFVLLIIPAQASTKIYINDEKDFIEFSKNCSLDKYSKDLEVILNKDLHLEDTDFSSIPIFYGTFNGNMHKIDGLKVSKAGSTLGLFRKNYGEIKNLNVSGVISPSGSETSLGMIAGENYGRIFNCSSSGEIKGKSEVGGIVGINYEDGEILKSKSETSITANLHAGGICGLNKGKINRCENSGDVNTSENQINKNKFFTIEDVKNEFLGDKTSSSIEVFSCVGGIAGRNSGSICYSKNKGDIGYVHLGYNVGGIAGIQNGRIKTCHNLGSIKGRKDIGGIIGQFEPDSTIKSGGKFSEQLQDEFNILYKELNNLNNQVENSSNKAINGSETINSSLNRIESNLKDTAKNLNEESKDNIDKIFDSLKVINETSKTMLDDYEKYSVLILDDAKASRKYASSIIDESIAIIDNINDNSIKTNEEIKEQRKILKQQKENLLALENNFNNINSYLKQYSKDIENQLIIINNTVSTLNSIIKNVTDTASFFQNLDDINESLKTLLNASSELAKISNSILSQSTEDFDIIIDVIFEAIDVSANSIAVINDSLADSVDSISANTARGLESIQSDREKLDSHLSALEDNSKKLSELMTANLKIVNKEVGNIEDLARKEFDYANENLHSSYDDIYKDALIVNEELNSLIKASKTDSKNIHESIRKINSTFKNISDLSSNIARKPKYEYENTFDFNANSQQDGTIAFCKNDGIITGDSDVGGICGNVSFEIGNNPEKDFFSENNVFTDTTAILRAIIYKSNNNASIKVKTDYAGGIVGKANTGVIFDCTNKGNIEGINYLGGICGYSSGDILNSNVLCDLKGKSYIGGIAGHAKNISFNNSMVRIDFNGEKIGAIAGEADMDDEANIDSNYFVYENIGGIDGISYDTKATPLDYANFINRENIPEYYNTLFVRFYDGNSLIKTIKVEYGGDIELSEIPDTFYDMQTYSEWSDFQKNNITRSIDVALEYKPWITSISTSEKIPLFLAEGRFFPDDNIKISEINYTGDVQKAISQRAYEYIINSKDRLNPNNYTIRVKLKENEVLKLINNGTIEDIKYEMDGNYAIFNGKKTGKILILEKLKLNSLVIAGIVFAIRRFIIED